SWPLPGTPAGERSSADPTGPGPTRATMHRRPVRDDRCRADAGTLASPHPTHQERPVMPQIHLRAEPGDYAPLVLLPGDPNRARKIAERFDGGLAQSKLVTEHRAMYGWTGTYQGHPVSVQTSGMGT